MKAYNDNCRLSGYEETVDWYLAWEVYKYLYRNECLKNGKRYTDLCDAAEFIIISHQMTKDPQKKFLDVRDFYRFYVTLAKNEDEHNFVLTEEVEEYLLSIAKTKAERIADKIFEMYQNHKG